MKKFIQILSLVMVVAITCITLVGCKNQPAKEDNKENLVINEVNENGIGLKMTRLSNGLNGVSITATVLPSNATNKELIWELAWVERAGYKASDYNLSEYINKVVSSNTLNCNITMLKRFPMQIRVVVISKSNENITASCLFDCYKVMNFNCTEGGAQFELSYSSETQTNKIEYFGCDDSETNIVFEGMTYNSIFNTKTAKLNSITEDEIVDSFGTIDTEESYVILIGLSKTLKSELENAGFTVKNVDYVDFEETTIIGLLGNFISWDPNNIAPYKALINKLNSIDNWFELYISFTNKYNGQTVNYVDKTIQLKGFNVDDYFNGVDVESISLDNTSYIF